jgi:hypothetical protein
MAPFETPQELFAKCKRNARPLDKKSLAQLFDRVVDRLTFSGRPFKSEPNLDSALSTGASDDAEYKQIIREAWRYRALVKFLKKHSSRELRWHLLALWLQEEGICEPKEFVPPEIYKTLTRENRARLIVSIADFQHFHRIEAWKPYFERLLADRRAGKDLKQSGYDEDAIVSAQERRSAVAAVCDWLASKNRPPDATTLRNAHSRISRAGEVSQEF